MRRIALLIASSLVLAGCSSGERLAAFICENIPNEEQTWEATTLDDLQGKLDKAESLAAFHKEELPWTFDRETGDLYEYDEFEESFVPIKDFDTSFDSDPYNRYWTEYSSSFSKDGKKLKIKSTNMVKNVLLGERVEDVDIEIFDIDKTTVLFNPGKEDEKTAKCIDVPTTGIDVQWAEKKG